MLLRIIDNGKGKKRKPKKLTQAELEAQAAFKAMQARWDAVPKFARTERPKGMTLFDFPKLETPAGRTNTHKFKSMNANELGLGARGGAAYKVSPQYTGSKMLGVSVLHKSNGIPVFSDEEIKDISKMRR